MWQPKKIAIFVPTLQPGGAERVALHLADGFRRRGFSVDILVTSGAGAFAELVPQGARLISLGNTGRVLRAFPHLARYLREESPWCLVPVMDHSNVVSIWARWMAHTPTTVLATTHCLPSVEARHGLRLREKLSPYAVRFFLRFADGIVAVSTGVAKDLARTAKIATDRITVIRNPVLTPEYYRKVAESVPDFFPPDPGKPRILSVGRLVKSKDFSTLIQAFAEVRKELPSRLLILGEGEQRGVLERLICQLGLEGEVMMPGYSENPYAHMARAKALVLSSTYEAFGNVVVEALAAGIPVIATDCSGPREILQDGRLGELVPIGDVKAMTRAMLTVLRGGPPDVGSEYLKTFELDTVVDEYIGAMEVAVRNRHGRSGNKALKS